MTNPVDICSLCTGYISFPAAVLACSIMCIVSGIIAVIGYKVGLWLHR